MLVRKMNKIKKETLIVFLIDCEEKFRVRSTYHAHVKRHRNEKQQASTIYVCVLQNCQYTTSNKASMKQHLTKVHDYKQEKGKRFLEKSLIVTFLH
jgi:predicted phosphoadenosine phosphosulfate sulfurtransferase